VAGGVLAPFFSVAVVPVVLDESGALIAPGILQGGGGPASLYFQLVYTDPAQAQGWGFSNAVRVDFLE
jgi:hypothetical protein